MLSAMYGNWLRLTGKDAIMDALARGKREIVYPRWLRVGMLVQALAPAFMRRMVARSTRRPDTRA